MKKEEINKMDLGAVVANLGESGTLSHRPESGKTQEIVGFDLANIPEQRGANGELISSARDWARATFEDGGVLSCRSIMLSPEINWGKAVKTEEKLKAVGAAKLTFLYVEEKVSKRTGNTYKVAHFTPIAVG